MSMYCDRCEWENGPDALQVGPDRSLCGDCLSTWQGPIAPFYQEYNDLPTPEDAIICPDCGELGEHDYCGRERFAPGYMSAFGHAG